MVLVIGLLRSKHKKLSSGARPRHFLRSLTARVLAINLLALAILAGGFLYLDKYQTELLNIKADGLTREGKLIGRTLISETTTLPKSKRNIDLSRAKSILLRLAIPSERRVQLFLANGNLGVDSYTLPGSALETRSLPNPSEVSLFKRVSFAMYEWAVELIPPHRRKSLKPAPEQPKVDTFPLLKKALSGQFGSGVFESTDGNRVVLVALPLQSVRRVQGALLITGQTDDVDRSVRDVRFALVVAFLVALLITILLSLYLARTITRPVRRLAEAADSVSAGLVHNDAIPDFANRRDEIGILSSSLSKMTKSLWSRMDTIENFVADVAHEIKNPLTSLRSAVETAKRIDDEIKRRELLNIIETDVKRLDRLLSEIADASRIDTELSRLQLKPLNLLVMLQTLIGLHQYTFEVIGPRKIILEWDTSEEFNTLAVADRMAQVFQNLIDNALSFSPSNGKVVIRLYKEQNWINISVSDSGPGIPTNALDNIFQRFYTDRPDNNVFGSHSGLGLAISKQIINGHGGEIICQNLTDNFGKISGALFNVRLSAINIKKKDRNL
ncbi:MAG: histidine kinase [Gammaproteobacteria bacterium]|nr:histidine kinase [Gammaproteobacteria bacterium]